MPPLPGQHPPTGNPGSANAFIDKSCVVKVKKCLKIILYCIGNRHKIKMLPDLPGLVTRLRISKKNPMTRCL